MYRVGGNDGQVNAYQQGQGEAQTIQTPLSDSLFKEQASLRLNEERAKATNEKNDFEKRMDELRQAANNVEFDASAEVRGYTTGLLSEAAQLYQRTGVNPLSPSNTSPEAQAMQKKFMEAQNTIKGAGTVKTEMERQLKLIEANPEKYDLNDPYIQQLKEGLGNGKMIEYATGKKKLGQLKLKAPVTELIGTVGQLRQASNIADEAGWIERGPEAVSVMFRQDPAAAEGMINAANNYFDAVSPEILQGYVARADEMAKKLGVKWSPQEQFVYELGQDQFNSTPFNWYTALDESIKYGMDNAVSSTDALGTQATNSYDAAKKAVTHMLKDPRAFEIMKEQYGGVEQFTNWLAKEYRWGDFKKAQLSEGRKNEEMAKGDAMNWYKELRDPRTQANALAVFQGAKPDFIKDSYMTNPRIENGRIVADLWSDNAVDQSQMSGGATLEEGAKLPDVASIPLEVKQKGYKKYAKIYLTGDKGSGIGDMTPNEIFDVFKWSGGAHVPTPEEERSLDNPNATPPKKKRLGE